MTHLTGRWVLAAGCWFVCAARAPAQDVAEHLRAGDATGVHAAMAVVDAPDADEVNGLLALLNAGEKNASVAGPAAELAYAVLGWWSMTDSGIANELLDRYEQRDWPKIREPLLELATMGATDGSARAVRWLASGDARVQGDALRLLRRVGGDRATIARAIEYGLETAGDNLSAALGLIWEFQHASEDLRKKLEAHYTAATSWPDKAPILWAMVRGGAFRTDWLLAQWHAATEEQQGAICYAVGQSADAVALRLVAELPKREDLETKAVILRWLECHAISPRVRDALIAAADQQEGVVRCMIDVTLAHGAPPDEVLAKHWVSGLSSLDPQVQRVACQALIWNHARASSAAVGGLIGLLHRKHPKGSRLHGAAMLALAEIGEDAARAASVLKSHEDSDDLDLADLAKWARLRVLGKAGIAARMNELQRKRRKFWPFVQRGPLLADEAARFAGEIATRPQAAAEFIHQMLGCKRMDASAVPAVLLSLKHGPGSLRGKCGSVVSNLPAECAPLAVPRLLARWTGERPSLAIRPNTVRYTELLDVLANVTVHDADGHVNRRGPMTSTWPGDLFLEWLGLYSMHQRAGAPVPLLRWMAPRRPLVFQVAVSRLAAGREPRNGESAKGPDAKGPAAKKKGG